MRIISSAMNDTAFVSVRCKYFLRSEEVMFEFEFEIEVVRFHDLYL